MELPKTIKIGARTYKISLWEAREAQAAGARGHHWFDTGWIKIAENSDIELKANTLLHEILHGCWSQGDLSDDEQEHTVTVLANQLTQVFQDNPEVIKYLQKALTS